MHFKGTSEETSREDLKVCSLYCVIPVKLEYLIVQFCFQLLSSETLRFQNTKLFEILISVNISV